MSPYSLAHCSPLTITEILKSHLIDSLSISNDDLRGKCEDCVIGRQTRWPFDGKTETDLDPLELVSFDLWGPSQVQSTGGKVYFMAIVDGGTSYKLALISLINLTCQRLLLSMCFELRGELFTLPHVFLEESLWNPGLPTRKW